MRILFITGQYLPIRNGGIENYVHFIASKLARENEVEIAVSNAISVDDYIHDGIKVNVLHKGIDDFKRLLSEQRFGICHFQEFGENDIDLNWFAQAKLFCRKVFFTFHLPYLTCYKADFRYLGTCDCNTFTDVPRCIKCIYADRSGYSSYGESDIILKALTTVMNIAGYQKKLSDRISAKHKDLKQLISICDSVFLIGSWFKNLLEENGYGCDKLKEIPQIANLESGSYFRELKIKNKVVFVGRIEKQKGLHLLCEAMKSLQTEITLDVYGDVTNQQYFNKCISRYKFNYKGAILHADLLKSFVNYDFLILPSVFTEMYSLALKEAYLLKLPVIVSSAKGNKAAVKEGSTGFIFDYGNSKDLRDVLISSYKNLKAGWLGDFSNSDDSGTELAKILSHYNLNDE